MNPTLSVQENRCAEERSVAARVDLWIVSAVIVAMAVRLTRLDTAALWFDEIFTAQWVALSWREMISTIFFGDYGGDHLPFYFIVLKAWATLTGSSAWSLRLLNVIFSCASVVLIARIASALVADRSAARWAAWFAALSPFLVHHAQEARMYPLMTALAAASILLLARYLVGSSGRLGAGFVAVNIALLATHYSAVFLVGAQVLILLLIRPRGSWMPAAVVLSVLCLGQVTMALSIPQALGGSLYQLGLFSLPGLVWSMLGGYAVLPSSEELHAQGFRAAFRYLPLAAAAAVPLAFVAIAGVRSMTARARAVVLITMGATVLGSFAAHMILNIGINPRYASAALPAFLVLLAAGSAHGYGGRLLVAARVALLATMSVGLGAHLLDPAHGREDVTAVERWLDQNLAEREAIVVTSEQMAELAGFHWPRQRVQLFPDQRITVDSENVRSLTVEFPFVGNDRTIFVIGRSWSSDPDDLLQGELLRTYVECPGIKVRGIRVLCFVHPGDRAN
jgi:hypothetical protein